MLAVGIERHDHFSSTAQAVFDAGLQRGALAAVENVTEDDRSRTPRHGRCGGARPVLNRYHVSLLAYFLEKLRSTPDGEGTLLDHSLVLYGSSLSDGNQHNFSPLPIVLAGTASGQVKGGRHLQFPKDTRMSNLLLAVLNKLGVRTETFGDSTGVVTI